MKPRSKNAVGNTEGPEGGEFALDPLERHTYMIPQSLAKHLEKLVFNSKVKTNKSELVREALKSTYPTYESS